MSTLNPCPFCGHVGLSFDEGSTFRWMLPSCQGCGATCGEVRVQTAGEGRPSVWRERAIQHAIEAWNTRAALVEPVSSGSCDTALETSGDVEALDKVWVLGSGEYEQWMIHGIFDSLAAAADGAKAMYSDEYAVTWDEPEQSYGDTYFLRGHIPRSIPGKCMAGPTDFDITSYELRRPKAAERSTRCQSVS